MSKVKKFDITIDGVNFKSDKEGMLNLNDIWKAFSLPKSKRPSRWDSELSRSLFETRNMGSGEKQRATGNLVDKFIKGDEEAVTGYAMFISVDFYRKVIKAFVELRRGNLLAAVKITDTTQLESKAFNAWLAMEDSTIQQTLKMLGIVRPNFFQSKIKHGKQRDSLVERGILKYRNYGSHGTSLRMTAKGKVYLMENLEGINGKIDALYQAEKGMVV